MKKHYIQQEAEHIYLSPEEKTTVRGVLQVFVSEHPVHRASAVRELPQPRYTGYRTRTILALLNNSYMKPMAISLIIALLIGGSTSYAAESSLPGDLLFPVKVEINERFRTWAALSPESKVEWQARVAERRLEEAVTLTAQNRMTADVRAKIEANFEKNAERVQKHIASLEIKASEAVVDISSRFETSLSAHAAILEQVPAEESTRVEVKPLLLKIRAHAKEAAKSRHDAETQVATSANAHVQTAAEGRLKAARQKIAEVQGFVENSSASAKVKADANAKLKGAQNALIEGSARASAENYNEAFLLFQDAHRIAQEIQLFVAAQQQLDTRIQLMISSIPMRIGEELETEDQGGASIETEVEHEIDVNENANEELESIIEQKIKTEIGL